MSLQTPAVDIRQFLTNHLVDVFNTMLSLKVASVPNGVPQAFADRITGTVGFAGENVTGALYLHISADFAKQMSSAMLGLPPEEISGEQDVNDVVGECSNMVTGGLKSALCDAGSPCALSTPAIIRGASFHIQPMPEVQREVLVFDSGGNNITVEIHIKYS